jgi:pSer/pThr/pTyr-binding forkhead associated (FHA) protein
MNNNTVILEDLGSTNGSWLRLSPEGLESGKYPLEDSAVFKVGANTTFRVYTNGLCVSC